MPVRKRWPARPKRKPPQRLHRLSLKAKGRDSRNRKDKASHKRKVRVRPKASRRGKAKARHWAKRSNPRKVVPAVRPAVVPPAKAD